MENYPKAVILENRPCPNACPKDDYLVIEGQDRLHNIPGRFNVVCCKSCGLLRTNPRPTAETMSAYYPSDYAPYKTVAMGKKSQDSFVKKILKAIMKIEPRQLPPIPIGHMLEIGCASGAYLQEMLDSGWHVEGIEFSEMAAGYAAKAGMKVQVATVESAKAPDEPVDLVAAWMVLEHLHEPIESLKKIRSWVKKGAYLVASVPDSGSRLQRLFGEYSYDLHLPNHLYHYSPKSIELVLRNAGWQLKRVFWQRNCNAFLNSVEYIATNNGYKKIADFANWIRTAKNAGILRVWLGWVLGVTRQSGRMEIWAQPK